MFTPKAEELNQHMEEIDGNYKDTFYF